MKRNVFVLGVALFLVNGTYAQGFLDRLGNAAVNKAADKALKSSYLPV